MMIELLDEALRLTALIYDAALDADQWPLLLNAIASSVGAQGAMLRQVNQQTGKIGFFETLEYDPAYVRAYREHFHKFDYYQKHFSTSPTGLLLESDELIGKKNRLKSEYFNDYELPQDKVHNLGGVISRNEFESIQIGIQRGLSKESFSQYERYLLQSLMPHLARAVKIRNLLEATDYQRGLALKCLDQLRIGVLLLNESGRLAYFNCAAEKLLSPRMMVPEANGLTLPHPADTKRLRQLVSLASSNKSNVGGDMRCLIGKESYHFWVVPLPHDRTYMGFLAESGVAVFVSCDSRLKLPWQRVAAHYGLTPAEAKLASALAEGEELQTIADRFSITYGTARSQLKSIFAKTGARRQSELVAMLLRGVLVMCPTEEG